jgi:DNA-binding MarR family transcriptional regulator
MTMPSTNRPASNRCRAWQLLVKFYYAQRGHLLLNAAHDLSPAQCHVLHLIEPEQPLSMSRLADTLSCDASNVTGLVDRLESQGLIRRQPSVSDRRVKVLLLTPAGLRLRTHVLKQITEGSHPLSRLSTNQQRALVTILEILTADPPRRGVGRRSRRPSN